MVVQQKLTFFTGMKDHYTPLQCEQDIAQRSDRIQDVEVFQEMLQLQDTCHAGS